MSDAIHVYVSSYIKSREYASFVPNLPIVILPIATYQITWQNVRTAIKCSIGIQYRPFDTYVKPYYVEEIMNYVFSQFEATSSISATFLFQVRSSKHHRFLEWAGVSELCNVLLYWLIDW